jgi:Fic family protein
VDVSGAWPAVTYEELEWVSRCPRGTASRVQLARHHGPYLAAVPAAIADVTPRLPAETLSASTEAAQEVARFDAEIGGEIAPFSAALLRSESAASSQIENLTASARAIAEAALGEPAGSNARQVVGNVDAMRAALALADDVSADAILAMHRALLERTEPDIAGRWREEQVWIGGTSLGPHLAAFVPPHQDRVPGAIDDLITFVARDDIPVLAHVALAHAQFETIHPFPDGNGRTGRAVMHAMLRHAGLVRNVTVPISAGLLVAVDDYFDALTAYREGDAAPIVDRVTEAAYAAVSNGRQLIGDLRAVRADWNTRVRARRDAAAWRIADLLLRHPVVNATLISDELGIAAQNVYRSLAPLVDAEVLTSTGRQRHRLWRSVEVLAAVDAFARRAGRRRQGNGSASTEPGSAAGPRQQLALRPRAGGHRRPS